MSLPYKLGDSGDEIRRWQEWFNRAYRAYAPPVDGTFGQEDSAAVKEMQRRLGITQDGVFGEETARAARYPRMYEDTSTPPKRKHLAVVYRGTGGIIGEDYVSRVCQGVSDLVEEINPEFPATMGGIPVGAAGGPNDPSMARCVKIGVDDGKRIIDEAIRQNPNRKIVIGGYSAGAVAAALLIDWTKRTYPNNYLCSFSIGDPTRPVGGAFYGGKPAPGHGISSTLYGDPNDYRHCWLAAPGDMYTSVPDADSGKILQDFYDIISNVELSDPVKTFNTILDEIPQIFSRVGVDVDDLLKMLGSNPNDPFGPILNSGFNIVVSSIIGAISGKQRGIGAVIEAIVVALKFVAEQPPTAPHIQYEFREVWPGMTYLDLAIQHVRDWSTR